MADAGCNSSAGCQVPGAQLAQRLLQSQPISSLSTVQAALVLGQTGMVIPTRSVQSQKQKEAKEGEKNEKKKRRKKEKKTTIAISQSS